MKEIQLTQWKVAQVDDWNYDWANQWKWQVIIGASGVCYAARMDIKRFGKVRMHREIMKTPNDMEVDHIDGNGLNCQEYNMRNCTLKQNRMSHNLQINNTSGYKGVVWNNRINKWNARIKVNGKVISLRYHANKEDAARAYNQAALKYHGEFAKLNPLPDSAEYQL